MPHVPRVQTRRAHSLECTITGVMSSRDRFGPKRYAEPVALSSTAPADFPISGLAAFLVRSSRAVSTYLRSVLDARGNLERLAGQRKTRPKRSPAICDKELSAGPERPARSPRASREPGSPRFWVGPKRYAEPVALSSTAHVDFPISGLAAFLVRSSRAVSTYLRSVLDARSNLVGLDRRRKGNFESSFAICEQRSIHNSTINSASCG